MKVSFSYNGFYIIGHYIPGTSATQEEPGDDAEFVITTIEEDCYDELLKLAEEEYEESR